MHRKPHPDTEHSLILDSVGTEKGRELIVSGDKTGRWNSRFDLSLGQKVSETQRPNGKCKMRETISRIVGGLLALLFNINDNDCSNMIGFCYLQHPAGDDLPHVGLDLLLNNLGIEE